jgi:hypothetical protein
MVSSFGRESVMVRAQVGSGKNAFEVEFDPALGRQGHLRSLLAQQAVRDRIAALAAASHPGCWWRHGNDVVDGRSSREAVQALFDGAVGVADVEDVCMSWIDEDDYYRALLSGFDDQETLGGDWQGLAEDLAAAASEALGEDAPDLEAFEEAIKEDALDALRDADETSPLEQLDRALDLGITYVAGLEGGLSIDDIRVTNAYDNVVGALTVKADENFASFLRFVNLSSDDYLAAVRDAYGVDLRTFGGGQGLSEMHSRLAADNAKAWQGFCVEADPSRPALVSAEQAIELLDNASYGGVPVAYAYVQPAAFVRLWDAEDLDGKQVELTPSGSGKAVLVGLWDYANGSGHTVDGKGPVRLPMDRRSWHVDGVRGYGIDRSCGLANGHFRCSVAAVTVEPDLDPAAPSI